MKNIVQDIFFNTNMLQASDVFLFPEIFALLSIILLPTVIFFEYVR